MIGTFRTMCKRKSSSGTKSHAATVVGVVSDGQGRIRDFWSCITLNIMPRVERTTPPISAFFAIGVMTSSTPTRLMSTRPKLDEPSESTRKSMMANRGQDTKLEVMFRRELWRKGMRGYRKNVLRLPGKPDIVFGKRRVAVFLHGCFWHRCPYCGGRGQPRSNEQFWQNKFSRTIQRDKRNQDELSLLGYRVLVLWECQVRSDLLAGVHKVSEALAATALEPRNSRTSRLHQIPESFR